MQQKILSIIDLSDSSCIDLSSKQREMMRNVIREEWEVFSEGMMMWEKIKPIQWKST